MSKVIQIRGIPDDVHARLVDEADARGQSLTTFLANELARIAARPEIARHNADVVRSVQSAIKSRPTRTQIRRAIDDARAERR